ncbi:MAG: hypothetical protein LBN74_02045 [Prevotella sp.]|jgi:ribonuclease J|nr:hypothetical protein [Prevotella sp.]
MKITIHRGTRQIGGCVTEITAGNDRVFIDFGADLPGNNPASVSPSPIDGLTIGDGSKSALFFTHYHSDHTGRISDVLLKIPIYIGATAKVIHENCAKRMKSHDLAAIERMETFCALDKISIGGITVTPLMIDHSAFDAYMFLIEADGSLILHTGDFRLYGVRGGKTLKMLAKYASDIDWLICEGTTISRTDAATMSEFELQQKVEELMLENKYVFVLCSSTNIDRLGVLYHAAQTRNRLFVCDTYQKLQLETVRERHAKRSSFYDFNHVYSYASNLDELMESHGFCMAIRQNELGREFLKRYRGRGKIIYSMWTGYLKGDAQNDRLVEFLAPYKFEVLHTSGHASPEDLRTLYETLQPKHGLIPIHTDAPELFSDIAGEKLTLLEDGEQFDVLSK